MSDTDNSPEKLPTRGIDPPSSSSGPPPPHDFGVVSKAPKVRSQAVVESAAPDMPPPSTSRPWAVAAMVAAIGVVLVLVLGLVVVGIGSVLSLVGDPGEAAPPSASDESAPSNPDSGLTDLDPQSSAVETALQAKIDEYKAARDIGTLWDRIPDTDYNRTAVSAFLYFLTDLKLAASFGADTSDYLDQADELERKLLNQEPLGSDILIKLSDRTFTYNGDTGEGGYTEN